jgi:hypothetical protein
MPGVPPTRSDRRLLLVTGSFLLVAAVFFGGVIWLATTRDNTPRGAFFIGLERPLKTHIHEGSPLYFSNPGAGDGFWLDIEDGHLVALVLDRPGTNNCVVKWKEQQDAYIDCNGKPLQSRDLDHYKLTIGPRHGSPKRSVYVNLHTILRTAS